MVTRKPISAAQHRLILRVLACGKFASAAQYWIRISYGIHVSLNTVKAALLKLFYGGK